MLEFTRSRAVTQRFRFLAVDWGERIRDAFNECDLLWFDAFARWVAGTGEHPNVVCPQPHFDVSRRGDGRGYWAGHYGDAVRVDNPMAAAIFAGVGASKEWPTPRTEGATTPELDFTRTHRGRSVKKRQEAVKKRQEADSQRKAWMVEQESHEIRLRRTFFDDFRDVAGNPFRPVTIDPSWLTTTVVSLARGIYEERAWDRMPIIGDALMDAGCDNEEILGHCRGLGPHTKGCWLVDALLGKT